MNMEDLKSLDPKRPGDWPWPVKFAAFVGIVVLAVGGSYFAFFQGQLDTFDTEQAKEKGLKNVWVDKKKLAINLEAYKQQRIEIEQSFGALLKQLPTKREVEALLVDVNQAGLGRGLQFELFKPSPENVTEFYAEMPISVKVTGSYHDLGAFTSDVSKLPRIVLLNDLNVQQTKEGILSLETVAKTYRYLDEEESAKQRKATKDKAAAAAKPAGAK